MILRIGTVSGYGILDGTRVLPYPCSISQSKLQVDGMKERDSDKKQDSYKERRSFCVKSDPVLIFSHNVVVLVVVVGVVDGGAVAAVVSPVVVVVLVFSLRVVVAGGHFSETFVVTWPCCQIC